MAGWRQEAGVRPRIPGCSDQLSEVKLHDGSLGTTLLHKLHDQKTLCWYMAYPSQECGCTFNQQQITTGFYQDFENLPNHRRHPDETTNSTYQVDDFSVEIHAAATLPQRHEILSAKL